MLSLRDITISIADEMPLISGLSVDIEPGSLRLIQGASGSGKSTLLSVICGTADRNVHATGDVLLNGRVVSGLDAEDRRIGLMFQDPLLFPHMSIGDNLAIALAAHHRHDRKARVSDASSTGKMRSPPRRFQVSSTQLTRFRRSRLPSAQISALRANTLRFCPSADNSKDSLHQSQIAINE